MAVHSGDPSKPEVETPSCRTNPSESPRWSPEQAPIFRHVAVVHARVLCVGVQRVSQGVRGVRRLVPSASF